MRTSPAPFIRKQLEAGDEDDQYRERGRLERDLVTGKQEQGDDRQNEDRYAVNIDCQSLQPPSCYTRWLGAPFSSIDFRRYRNSDVLRNLVKRVPLL